MNLKKYLSGAVLFLLAAICSHPAQADVVRVELIHSRNMYHAGGSYPILVQVAIEKPWFIHGERSGEDGLIPTLFAFDESDGLKVEEIRFPEPEIKRFKYVKEPVEVLSGKILVRATLVVGEKAPEGRRALSGRLSFQACTAVSCLQPEEISFRFPVLIASRGSRVEYVNRDMFETGAVEKGVSTDLSGLRTGAGLWLTLIGIFIGGLALNLTPCIYPLIPITVSYFGGRSGKIKGRSLVHGALYVLGLACTNSVLGVAAGLSGGLLGSALQKPLVLIFVAGIMIFLALSFFGLWELRLPSGLNRFASKNLGGFPGTFFMGLTLGVVAAPCLGPFILGLLTYVGQKGDPLLGFVYFFVLSIGMGLPLAVLAVFSGALEKLPLSGEWMVWIRKFFGWVLVGMAGYMLRPLIPHETGKAALFAVILVSAGAHLGWRERIGIQSRVFPYVRKGLGVILFAAAVFTMVMGTRGAPGVRWIPYDPSLITEAGRDMRPVILDFYADWCGPCRAMKDNAFRHPDVVKLSRSFVALEVDLTIRHPEQEKLLRQYRIKGVPTILFMNRQGREEKGLRIESYAGPEELLERMRQLITP